MKVCSKCKRELDVSCFSKDKKQKDGLNIWCRECCKQYMKQYREDNKEQIKQQMKQYREDNKEQIKQHQNQYKKQWRNRDNGTFQSWFCMCKRIRYCYRWYKDISICDRWHWTNPNGYNNFLEDMGIRPTGMTIDRINPFWNYCKENCRLATQKEQINNRRRNFLSK